MNYKLIWEPHGVVIRFSGTITINDIVEASVDYEKDWRFDNLFYVIADYTQIASCTSKPEQIDEVWIVDAGAKMSNNRIKKAVVATSPEVIAMAEHYKGSLGSPFPVKCFNTEIEAREWINVR